MCGIVGVIGKKNATQILLKGLEKLEYRGYDSAGIYVNDQAGHDHLIKRVGHISNLEKAVTPDVQGVMGIGHTRWATNGGPTEANAHPQVSNDERFYLVHNGVVTNANDLKQQYLQDIELHSDTDTEVVVQLIALFARQGLSAKEALRKILKLIQGSYAFSMVDRLDPTVLYVAKNKSPLLIGRGKGFNVVASDALAMLSETDQFVELKDQEIVTLTADTIHIETLDGKVEERKPFTVKVDDGEVSKGTYPFFMLKEIDEQPIVMRRLVEKYTDDQHHVVIPEDLMKALQQADRLYIVAAGTSYHAGLVGAPLFEQLAGIPAEVHVASEFAYHQPLLSKHPLFIFLTQSGETADIRQVLVEVKKQGYQTLTITNVGSSTLAREATFTLLLHGGPEIAVASTKAYTAQIAVEALVAKAVGEAKGLQAAKDFDVIHQLGLAATGQQALIDQKDRIHELATDMFKTTRNAFYIGRGGDYYASLEAALKLKEISYVQAEGFAAGELKHGTIALIEKDTPVVAIISDPVTAARTRSNADEVQARGAKVLHIAMAGQAQKGDQIIVDDIDPLLAPLVTIIPAQLLAYFTSADRGYDVDRPRNLAKSVTVE
ncbi:MULTISPECIES: glutamine--fructose-6-phosphate transaminase (isomerizing) [Lacticaseibacillus]|uniref:Glutamine--fructose-6-phosphate aminotransferase [isomerizing] n=1 Tax=Lacticaseibacillus huelsenbergensis TaxID=3035291 RepID=A0ABY8DNI0_9LACO|nr:MULTISPECIES: glutamine--fructose-6-phosphate transaminase (isomerizing) [Lacticaseibacillus]MDG3062699.1 glutamine--fructose-6-phosphate transaminase (isomerizing) [Lacticaseibacillus sp. BCRC 81376]WFB38533.1 glutamine--fructose-6-phosphate transaminase (isomerizing) [Lacticaseibacillus huelsenbergensis]